MSKKVPFNNNTRTQYIDKLLGTVQSYLCVVREGFQMWALIFSWPGENRHTLLVFNPGLTPLNHSVSAAVILTYICQSFVDRGQCAPPPINSTTISKDSCVSSSNKTGVLSGQILSDYYIYKN